MQQHHWHTEHISDIFSVLTTYPSGLTSDEATQRLDTYGPNELRGTKKVTLLSIIFEQLKSPLIALLLVAVVIVLALGEIADGIIIFVVILINTIIGTIQEGKARNMLAALQKTVRVTATVLRDGDIVVVQASEIVPGDVIVLRDGDIVPADARIFESNHLRTNESALTGESTPIQKQTEPILGKDEQISEQTNMVFRGTYVVSGEAKAVVVGTGQNTAIGSIAKKLDDLHSEVPLKANIKRLSRVLIGIVIFFSIVIFLAGVVHGNSVSDMFITVVALAVSAIPESLPVVVTLVLATGVWRMSKRNVLVKRLQAVEALGQAKVIALDKTGTITKNQMMVEELWVADMSYIVTGDGYNPHGKILDENKNEVATSQNSNLQVIGKVAALTASAAVIFDDEQQEWLHVSGDPTEAALVTFAQKIGMPKKVLADAYKKVLEIPFTFETKHHTVVHEIDGENQLLSAGSPEVLLQAATKMWKHGGEHELTAHDREKILQHIDHYSSRGYRLIALGIKHNPDIEQVKTGVLSDITFIGLMALTDVIRDDVDAAVLAARHAGMRVVMITGDHAQTAMAIAERVSIYQHGDTIITGKELEEYSDTELDNVIPHVSVFARVAPEHKLRIIESFKRRGEIVAMTGDGINDALSLVAADLGVSMGKVGTEVAREASDIVLLDDNFDNIRVAAEEGRAIYQTIRKSVLYLLSTNVGELLVIAVAVLLGWPIPLLATQIVWLNMVTDTFLVAALAVEPKEKNLLKKRFKKPSPYIVDGVMGFRIFLLGSTMTLVTLFFFHQYMDSDIVKAWTITLTVLTVCQWYNIWNVRSDDQSIFSTNQFNNPWLILGAVFAVGLHLFAIYHPVMQSLLKTTALSLHEWLVILMVSLVVIVVEEIRKGIARFRYAEGV